MKVIVLKTDISSKRKLNFLMPVLNDHQAIKSWSVDTKDIDNVLRIETKEQLLEKEVIRLIGEHGFIGEGL